MISLEECINTRKIEKFPQGYSLVADSLERAKELLDEARSSFAIRAYDSVIVLAYSAAFLAARAILFKDGYREKSHECLIEYLRSKHKEIPEHLLQELNHFRLNRHGALYDVRFRPTREECEEAIKFAQEFILTIERLV